MTTSRTPVAHDGLKDTARAWFENLRDRICDAFERIEDDAAAQGSHPAGEGDPGRFERTPWNRN